MAARVTEAITPPRGEGWGLSGPSQGDPTNKAKGTEEGRGERNCVVLWIARGLRIQPCLQPGPLLAFFGYVSKYMPVCLMETNFSSLQRRS